MKANNYEYKFNILNKNYNTLTEREREIQIEKMKVGHNMHKCFSNWLKEKLNKESENCYE